MTNTSDPTPDAWDRSAPREPEHPQSEPGPVRATASTSASAGERRVRLGRRLLLAGTAALVALGFCPAPYAIRMPGPVFDGLGEVTLEEGAEPQEIIQISGADVHEPEAGRLDVLTVSIQGSPAREPSWFEALMAWADPTRDVLPIEAYFPSGETVEQRDAETAQQMTSSQDVARAAALHELGYDVPSRVLVAAVVEGSPAEGLLAPGDTLLAANGREITGLRELREATVANGTSPMSLRIDRQGTEEDVVVTPQLREIEGVEQPALGIQAGLGYDFPVDISISLGDVGGPSAGMMLSLGIIDKLTPGDLTGGRSIAGTGTIDESGAVGPIGGIRLKLLAAIDTGAEAFLAPVENCGEATGRAAPDTIPIYAVESLSESRAAVDAIASGQTEGLRTCRDVLAAASSG